MRMEHSKLQNRGYTFIELLGAIAIIILVITPILFMFSSLLEQSLKAQLLTNATTVCNSVIDRVKYDVINGIHENINVENISGTVAPEDYTYYNMPQGYMANLNVEIISDYLCEIEVQVSVKTVQLAMKTLVYYE